MISRSRGCGDGDGVDVFETRELFARVRETQSVGVTSHHVGDSRLIGGRPPREL